MQDGSTAGVPTSGRLAALRTYWLGKHCGTSVPVRSAIDPTEIPSLLSNIMLLDVEPHPPAPPRFRFRLTGTGLVEVFGHDPTGRYLDEAGAWREAGTLLVPLQTVVAQAVPLVRTGWLRWDNGASVDMEWLFLPLSCDGTTVTIILAGADFHSQSLQFPLGEPRIDLAPFAGR